MAYLKGVMETLGQKMLQGENSKKGSDMKVLIIGGTGCVSGSVVREAVKQGIQVTCINRGLSKAPGILEGVETLIADKNDTERIKDLLRGRMYDTVVDFLCYTAVDAEKSFALYSQFATQYVFISSRAVYTQDQNYAPFSEDAPKLRVSWSYSKEKWASEERLRIMARTSSCALTIIRPSIVYDNSWFPYGFETVGYGYYWTFAARVLAGKPLIRWDKGLMRTNMLRAEDFAVGAVGLLGNPRAYGEAFNICGDIVYSWNDVFAALSKALGKPIVTVDITSQFYARQLPHKEVILAGWSIDGISSNAKVKTLVPNFKQTISLEEGVAKTIKAYRENNYQKGIDWAWDGIMDRIIAAWCAEQGQSTEGLNLRFVDYLGTANWKSRLKYYRERYRNTKFGRFLYAVKAFCQAWKTR